MNSPEPSIKFQVELTPEERQAKLALQEQTFSIAFETFLEKIADGAPLNRVCMEYHTNIVPSQFRSWVYRDTKRKQAYMVAKAIGAEAVEDELIRISDGIDALGNPSPEETNRSALRIKTRQWLLEIWNPKRYAQVTKIEQTTTTKHDVAAMSTDDLRRLVMERLGMNSGGSMIFDVDPLDPLDPLNNPEDGFGG
jgi:hypothetical protein